jgi:hypothetical protein
MHRKTRWFEAHAYAAPTLRYLGSSEHAITGSPQIEQQHARGTRLDVSQVQFLHKKL